MIHSVSIRARNSLLNFFNRAIPQYGDRNDPESILVHQYWQFACLITLAVFTSFGVNSLRLKFYELAFGEAIIVLNVFVSNLIYRKTKSIDTAVHAMIAISAPATAYRTIVIGGIYSPILLSWPVISILALMTISFYWTAFWTLFHIGIAILFYVAYKIGVSIPSHAPPGVGEDVRIAMICTVQVVLLASVYFIRKLNSNLREIIRKQSEKITEVVRTLSHDLSSPLMTLQYRIQAIFKSQKYPDGPWQDVLDIIYLCYEQISNVRDTEAHTSKEAGARTYTHIHAFGKRDSEETLIHSLFIFTTIAITGLFFFFTLFYILLGQTELATYHLGVAGPGLIAWWIFKKTRSVTICAALMLLTSLIAAISAIRITGGIESPIFFMWPVVPVFSGIVLSIDFAGFSTAIFSLVAIGFEICRRLGIVFPTVLSPDANALARLVSLGSVQLIFIFAINHVKKQNQRFRSLAAHGRKRKLRLLATLNSSATSPLLRIYQILSQYPGDPEISEALRAAKACVDLIDHTQSINETFQSSGAVDLRDVIRDITFLQTEALVAKRIHWNTKFPPREDTILVLADRAGLTYQVLNNLLSNAIKFTQSGGTVEISVRDGDDYWNIGIIDNGIGIPADLLNQLFDPSKQTTRKGTAGESGTGFGMPIVKTVVESYGGSLNVESKTPEEDPLHHGTRIQIKLRKAKTLMAE